MTTVRTIYCVGDDREGQRWASAIIDDAGAAIGDALPARLDGSFPAWLADVPAPGCYDSETRQRVATGWEGAPP